MGKPEPPGRIDPKANDIAGPKRRRRKLRNRDEPHDILKDEKPAAYKRASRRAIPPDIILEPDNSGREHWTSPHADEELWRYQLGDCFGTRSHSVLWAFLGQLQSLLGKGQWDATANLWRADEHEFAAVLAIINSLKPRNELEAAHAAQMVAVHLMTMKVAARALRYEHDVQTAAVAGKLARTFTAQREAFERIRKPNRTSRQSIKVTKETHFHHHQHLHRAGEETDGQPHDARAATIEGGAPLPGDEPGGQVLRLPSRARPRRVS